MESTKIWEKGNEQKKYFLFQSSCFISAYNLNRFKYFPLYFNKSNLFFKVTLCLEYLSSGENLAG